VSVQPQLEHEEGAGLEGADQLLGLEGGGLGLPFLHELGQEGDPEPVGTGPGTAQAKAQGQGHMKGRREVPSLHPLLQEGSEEPQLLTGLTH